MQKKTILLAEDEPAYGKILKSTLEQRGYNVEVVMNGDALLKLARVKVSQLIILDMVMPVKTGFQVLEEMRKEEKLKHLKVIALSNLGQEEDVEKARKLGACDYIIKSDESLNSVMSKIEKLLN